MEEWTASASGFLLGRRSYEEFSAVWPTVTDPSDSNAVRLNTLPKYVAAPPAIDARWGPVRVLDHDVEAAVGGQHVTDPLPNDRVVVRDEHANALGQLHGVRFHGRWGRGR